MKKKWLKTAAATALALTLSAGQVFAAGADAAGQQPGGMQAPGNGNMQQPGGMGGNSNYSHGSSETVTEDMLVTESAIAADYDVNEDTQGSAKKGEYASYFNHEEIEDVYIDIDENNWNYMLQNANEKPTVMTNSVTISGEAVQYASIKTKGNLTLSSVWSSNSDRFSFTVNFSKYIKKKKGYSDTQNFHGLQKVAFNNIYGDASLMKEYLSYELMTQMGVPTPCYSLVNLYVNDELRGVNMMIESVDSSLTKRTLGESSDYLVKPESSGGDLVYDSALDSYINEEGEFEFDVTDYPIDASNPLYKYNGLWENDEDTFADVADMLPTLFKWMKTLNELNSAEDANTAEYKEKLESIIDVDEILRYFAANTYLVNLDSYQSEKMQNYTLYLNEDGYAHVLPWDYNYSFGGYGVQTATAMVNFSITNPVIDVALDPRPLLNVLLQNDDYRALYEKYLADCCTIASAGGTTSDGNTYEAGNFASILANYVNTLNSTYANDPTAFYTVSQYQAATQALTTLIFDRTTAVTKQLAGDTEEVQTTVNLQTIGDAVGGGGNPGGQPGGNPGQMTTEEMTLTDEELGISVHGTFVTGTQLNASALTSGTEYDLTKQLLSKVSDTFKLYNITTTFNGGSQMPGGNDGNVPSMPGDVSEGGADVPQMPGGNQGGTTNQTLTFSIQIPEEYQRRELSVYRINTTEETKTELNAVVSGDSVTFKSSETGLFALTAGDKTVTQERAKGDVDGNGTVELADAQLTLKAALRIIELTGDDLKAADVDESGEVNLEDAQKVLKAALKIEPLE